MKRNVVEIVDAGEAILDKLCPYWRSKMQDSLNRTGRLDMGSSCMCVLGRLGGPGQEYLAMLRELMRLEGLDYDLSRGDAWARAHGFQKDLGISYADLTEEWMRRLDDGPRITPIG